MKVVPILRRCLKRDGVLFFLYIDRVIRGSQETCIPHHLSFASVDHPVMVDPVLSIPDPVFSGHIFNGNKAVIRKDKLAFCDTGQFRNLPLLAQIPVHPVFHHGHSKHLAGC